MMCPACGYSKHESTHMERYERQDMRQHTCKQCHCIFRTVSEVMQVSVRDPDKMRKVWVTPKEFKEKYAEVHFGKKVHPNIQGRFFDE